MIILRMEIFSRTNLYSSRLLSFLRDFRCKEGSLETRTANEAKYLEIARVSAQTEESRGLTANLAKLAKVLLSGMKSVARWKDANRFDCRHA
jgi:hypothetical protein